MKKSQNTLNSKRCPERFSIALTTNNLIIQLIMATITSTFEGAPSPDTTELGGKAISLAIMKTTTD